MKPEKPFVFEEINHFISELNPESISEERKSVLLPLIDYIQSKVTAKAPTRLNFICTHNSRRSHLSQVWAQVMAAYWNIDNVFCYSGGTEATALFPMAATTLINAGLQIETLATGNNPIYSIKFASNAHPIIGFSKTHDAAFNPSADFAAIMTCSHADTNCPLIPGAEQRFPMTFDDPKAFDDSPLQAEKYQERSIQIATELFFVFSQVKREV